MKMGYAEGHLWEVDYVFERELWLEDNRRHISLSFFPPYPSNSIIFFFGFYFYFSFSTKLGPGPAGPFLETKKRVWLYILCVNIYIYMYDVYM